MRILLLAPHEFYADRGTPIAVDILLRALSAQGHEVDVLAYHLGSTPGYPNVTVHRISRLPFIRSVPPGLSGKKLLCDAAFFAAMLRLLARRQFDVVHAVEESVFMAMVARALFGVPYVYDMDSSPSQQVLARLPVLRPIAGALRVVEGLAVRYGDAVAPVCDALARVAAAHRPRRLVMRLIERYGLRGKTVLELGSGERKTPRGTSAMRRLRTDSVRSSRRRAS